MINLQKTEKANKMTVFSVKVFIAVALFLITMCITMVVMGVFWITKQQDTVKDYNWSTAYDIIPADVQEDILAEEQQLLAEEEALQVVMLPITTTDAELEQQAEQLMQESVKALTAEVPFTRGTGRTYNLIATGYTADHDKAPYYGITKSGVRAKEWHTVAVDTEQFPLGTVFYIKEFEKYNGTGIYVAEDTGGAIDYGDIDICVPTTAECYSKVGKRVIEVEVIKWGKR